MIISKPHARLHSMQKTSEKLPSQCLSFAVSLSIICQSLFSHCLSFANHCLTVYHSPSHCLSFAVSLSIIRHLIVYHSWSHCLSFAVPLSIICCLITERSPGCHYKRRWLCHWCSVVPKPHNTLGRVVLEPATKIAPDNFEGSFQKLMKIKAISLGRAELRAELNIRLKSGNWDIKLKSIYQ